MQSPAKAPDGEIKLEDEGADEEDDEEKEGHDSLFQLPTTTTNSTRNSKVKRSNSTSDVERYTSANKNNQFRNFGSSRKQIEAVSPKAKMYNGGGGQGKAVRIARVRLNMRRSSDEPKTRATVTVSAPTTPVTRSSRTTPQSSPQPKQSAIRWQNKLKPRMLRTYTRRRLPVLNVASDAHICVDTPCEFCLLHNVTETRNHGNKEDEENALLISHQSVGAVCPTLKTEKVDQQTPLVIKNNNDLSYNPSPNHDTTLDPQYKVVRTSRATSTTTETTTTTTTTATTNHWQKTSRKSASKRKVNSAAPISQEQEEEQPQQLQEQNNASAIVLDPLEQQVNDNVSPLSRPKAKRRERSSKAKAEHAIVVRKTMIAMTAAAATVMSNPIKPSEEEEGQGGQAQNTVIDPLEVDTINQSISSVIAWAKAYYDTNTEGEIPDVAGLGEEETPPNPTTSLPPTSPSTATCEINEEEEKRDFDNENEKEDAEFSPMMPPDNLSINGEADYLTSEDGNMSASCSMKGQLSDEDDESEPLLSVGNSPAPSWADGDTMSRSELVGKMVEKMLLVEDNVMDQQQQQGLKNSPMAESRS